MELMYVIYLIEVVTNIKMCGFTVGIGVFVFLSATYLLISAIQADTTRDVYFKDRLEVYFKTIKKEKSNCSILFGVWFWFAFQRTYA